MTPKEKAKELVQRYYKISGVSSYCTALTCALVAVDEMIQQNGELYLNDFGKKSVDFYKKKNAYLFEVKAEIKLL